MIVSCRKKKKRKNKEILANLRSYENKNKENLTYSRVCLFNFPN